MYNNFYIGVDLAQMSDFTAITVFEESGTELHLRHIERPARGTSYPAIVSRVKELYNSSPLNNKRKTVIVDLTGVGRPVYDMMDKAGFGYNLTAITITGGQNVTKDKNFYCVPKRDLITALQVALQNKTLKIAEGLPEAETFLNELINFKVKINLNGHDQYGADGWREGAHDDIVLSASLCVWLATQPKNYIASYRRPLF